MGTAVRLVEIGSVISIDEAIVGFKGQSRHKVAIKNKPTPTGRKGWGPSGSWISSAVVLAPAGSKYGPVGMEAIARARDNTPDNSYSQRPDNPVGIIRGSSSDDSADEGIDEALTFIPRVGCQPTNSFWW
jgi:hypothetical protein